MKMKKNFSNGKRKKKLGMNIKEDVGGKEEIKGCR